MKQFKYGFLILTLAVYGYPQDTLFDVSKLSVPQSSAIQIIDVSPTLIENPTTPKQFAIGVIQDIASSKGLPQNYSMEFTPYWWILPTNRNIYNFLGIAPAVNPITKATEWKENIFSSLKFMTVSAAFVSKDLIPDTIASEQKVISGGLRANLISIHNSGYAKTLAGKIQRWHDCALENIDAPLHSNDPIAKSYKKALYEGNQDSIVHFKQLFEAQKNRDLKNIYDSLSADVEKKISEKPILSWDAAVAYSEYGIGDTTWQTGRAGLWTTATLNLPLAVQTVNSNFLSLSAYARYMYDGYAVKNGSIGPSNSIDVGGKLAIQFDKADIGAEGVYRKYSGISRLESQRVVGFINYCIGDNLYVYGSFGKNFGFDKPKLLSIFGISWGIGHEMISL